MSSKKKKKKIARRKNNNIKKPIKKSNTQVKKKKYTNNKNKLKNYDIKEKKKKKIKKKHKYNINIKNILINIKKVLKYIFDVIVLILSYILYFILLPIKLLITYICKVFKKIPKSIKKRKIKQYNKSINNKTVSKKSLEKKKKYKKIKIDKKHKSKTKKIPDIKDIDKHKLTKSEKRQILNSDELILLKYRDYKGFRKILVFFRNRIRVMSFDMRRFKKKFKYGTLKDKILIILMILLILGFSAIVAFCVYIVINAPDTSPEKLYSKNASILYYQDDNGNWVEFARLGLEKREKITYDELPEVLIDAIVATEDSRFFQHDGIDIARFTKATFGQLLGQSNAGGGSTLTMQVSKNAYTSRKSSGIEGILRKFTDIYLSVFVLEKKYTKEEIMEFYVNTPFLGAHSYGVEQAANAYFGKSVTELNLAEAATIAGLFQAPYSYDCFAHPVASEKRRNTVLNLMYRHGYITEEERDTAQAIPLESTLTTKAPSENKYQDFIDTVIEFVIKETKAQGYTTINNEGKEVGLDPTTTPMKIYTTLKPNKQNVVDGIISGETYQWRNDQAQAGIVVTDVKTGAIVAVGASRDPGERMLNFATSISRHPGSTAKPIVDYGPAFEYLGWSTGQTVIDDEIEYEGGYGAVRNFDKKFNGIMTAKTALANSRNVPALLTFRQTTNEQKMKFSNGLGWHADEDNNGVIYESASIGGFKGVNPVQASSAYAAFARGGTYISPYIFTKIEFIDSNKSIEPRIEKSEAMSEETAFMINSILRYAVSSGVISAGKSDVCETAAKTGTSTVPESAKQAAGIKGEIIGNSWLNVYSTDYSISTWYGYKNEVDPSAYLTSSEGSAERKKITQVLVKGIMEPGAAFTKPDSIVEAEIELETDPLELASPYTPAELRSKEYFRKGEVPEKVSERFAQLSNPSNLKYTSTSSTVTLNWQAANIPKAINTEYLRSYFQDSKIYATWADKYLQRRLEYNAQKFGQFGYEIYMINQNGTIDLGFTTQTTFTANVNFTSQTKFIVKTSYQYFKANQSNGITVTVAPNSGDATTPTDTSLSVSFATPSCITASGYKNLGAAKNKVKVTSGGIDVTQSTEVTESCKDASGNPMSCNLMTDGNKYTATLTVNYKGVRRNINKTIEPKC